MNIKALPEMQNLSSYLDSMELKKSFIGGYDRSDVEMHISRIVNMNDALLRKVVAQLEKEQGGTPVENLIGFDERLQEARKQAAQQAVQQLEEKHRQTIVKMQEEHRAKSENLKKTVTMLEKAAKQMYVKAKEDAAERIRRAEEEANAIVVRAEGTAKRIVNEAQIKVDKQSSELRKSLSDLKSHVESEDAQFSGIMMEYARLVEEIRNRDESMKGRIDSFYSSMANIIEHASRLDTGVDHRRTDQLEATDSSMWSAWISQVLDSVENEAAEDPTLVGHRRFAESVASAQERLDEADDVLSAVDVSEGSSSVKGAHAAESVSKFDFSLD